MCPFFSHVWLNVEKQKKKNFRRVTGERCKGWSREARGQIRSIQDEATNHTEDITTIIWTDNL